MILRRAGARRRRGRGGLRGGGASHLPDQPREFVDPASHRGRRDRDLQPPARAAHHDLSPRGISNLVGRPSGTRGRRRPASAVHGRRLWDRGLVLRVPHGFQQARVPVHRPVRAAPPIPSPVPLVGAGLLVDIADLELLIPPPPAAPPYRPSRTESAKRRSRSAGSPLEPIRPARARVLLGLHLAGGVARRLLG